ncbi:MAG: acyltransferase [Acidimicrobiales bacterium]
MSSTAPTQGTRKRLDHIDAMRPVKQAAVISTHTLIFFAPLATNTTVIGLIMLTRFSREAFLFVSACMLTYSYREIGKMKLNHYWRRRFMSVGVPYLAWTVIYFFYTKAHAISGFPYYSYSHTHLFDEAGFRYFLTILKVGYYHLYYLLVIIEFYLIFPLLLAFVRRFAKWHIHMMVLATLWQVAYGVIVDCHSFGIRLTEITQTRFIFSYVVYLLGGMIVALHLEDVHDWIVAKARWIICLTVASAVAAEILSYWNNYRWLPQYLKTGTLVFAPAMIPFNFGAILCVYLLGVYLVAPERRVRTRAIVQSGSDNSYGVYLSQMLWIPFLVRVRNHFGWHITWQLGVLLALVVVYVAGFIFTALVARTRLAKPITGRSQVSWSSLWPRRFESPSILRGDLGDGPLDVVQE